ADHIAPEAEPAGPADVADRLDDVTWLDQRRGDLGEERGEEQGNPVADQQQLDVGAAAEPPPQDTERLQPGEAATENHDACHAGEFLRLKQRELGTRLGPDAHLVVAGEARVAELARVATRRLQHALQREVAERIRADVAPDLVDGVAGPDQLLPRRRVDPVVAGPLDRRRRDPPGDLASAGAPDQPNRKTTRLTPRPRPSHDS